MTDIDRILMGIKMYRGGLLAFLGACNRLISRLSVMAASQISRENISILEMWRDKLIDISHKIRFASNEIYNDNGRRKTEYAGDDNPKILEHIKIWRETKAEFEAISSGFCNAVEKNILVIPNLNDRVEIDKALENVKSLKREVESF
jgi:hypothetical protein